MTTILADRELGVMVSDSSFSDGVCVGNMRKIWRVKGALVGMAGNLDEFEPFLAWYRGGMEGPPPRMKTLSALVLSPGRILHFANSHLPFTVQSRTEAIGSGAMAAKAAHEALAFTDPRKAVQIACRHDAGSRAPVRTYQLT